jgi:hypothetical protein
MEFKLNLKLPRLRIVTAAKLIKMAEALFEGAKLAHIADCNRPLKQYVVKLKGGDEIRIKAHRFYQGKDSEWLLFTVNDPDAEERLAFSARLGSIEWFSAGVEDDQ